MEADFIAQYLLGARRALAVRTLLADPQRPWSAAALQRESGLSYAAAQRELRMFASLGLLQCERRSKAMAYSVLPAHPAMSALRDLLGPGAPARAARAGDL